MNESRSSHFVQRQRTLELRCTKEQFHEFWMLYPKKKGKRMAQRNYMKLPKDLHDGIILALKAQLPSMKKTEARFIPYPATWLRDERWEDEVELSETERLLKKYGQD